MRDLQLCSSEPGNLDAARAVLGASDTLSGIHHRVTITDFGRVARAQIRTLPVLTHPAGHIDVRAVSGSYRYLLTGKGSAELHVRSTAGTIVDIVGPCSANLVAADQVAVEVNIYAGTVTLTAADTTVGTVRVARTAECIVRHPGNLVIDRQAATGHIVAAPEHLTTAIVERARQLLDDPS